jgi:basic membrane protein A
VIGSVPIPELVRHINAFTIGARQAKPEVSVQVRWVNAFFAPRRRRPPHEAHRRRGGRDLVLDGHADRPAGGAAQHAAKAPEPIYALGNDNPNACDFAPEICLTTPYWNWGPS